MNTTIHIKEERNMNNRELMRCILQDPILKLYCQSVYACDTVPTTFKYLPVCYIMNTDPISKRGKHWVAVYLSPDGNHEFFDSYGRPGYAEEGNWYYNTKRLQGPMSKTCGQFCLYYLRERVRGRRMEDIIKDFDICRDWIENDKVVTDFINSKYNTNFEIYDFESVVTQISTIE